LEYCLSFIFLSFFFFFFLFFQDKIQGCITDVHKAAALLDPDFRDLVYLGRHTSSMVTSKGLPALPTRRECITALQTFMQEAADITASPDLSHEQPLPKRTKVSHSSTAAKQHAEAVDLLFDYSGLVRPSEATSAVPRREQVQEELDM
jgi:hypothetical protein